MAYELPAIETLSINCRESSSTSTVSKSECEEKSSECSGSSVDGSSNFGIDVLNPQRELRGTKRKMESLEEQAQRLAQVVIEECMSRVVIRKCWLCRRRYVKEDACNAVRCECGAVSCFHCGRRVADRVHPACPAVTGPEELRQALLTAAKVRVKHPRLAAQLLWQESSSDDD